MKETIIVASVGLCLILGGAGLVLWVEPLPGLLICAAGFGLLIGCIPQ